MTLQHNDAEFKKMTSKFGVYFKNGPSTTTHDEKGRKVAYSMVLPRRAARLYIIQIRTKVHILQLSS